MASSAAPKKAGRRPRGASQGVSRGAFCGARGDPEGNRWVGMGDMGGWGWESAGRAAGREVAGMGSGEGGGATMHIHQTVYRRDLKRRPLAEHRLNGCLGYTVVKRCVLNREQFGSTTQEFESMTHVSLVEYVLALRRMGHIVTPRSLASHGLNRWSGTAHHLACLAVVGGADESRVRQAVRGSAC